MSKTSKEEQRMLRNLNKNLSLTYSKCELILNTYKKESAISEKDYIWFVFSADIYYRIKDIVFLNKKLKETKNNFDSSLYVLSRSVLEAFIFFKYLFCEDHKIIYRLHAFTCHSTRNNELSILNSLATLGKKNKFIFSNNPENIFSVKMMHKRINEFNGDIAEFVNFHKNEHEFEEEIKLFKSIEEVAKKYDKIKNINSVVAGSENKSLEWMYNYVYRFQCMSAHQGLRDKEKVFNLFYDKKEPCNMHIIGLLDDIVEQILIL